MNNYNVDSRLATLYEYLENDIKLTSDELAIVRNSVGIIHKQSPIDRPLVFRRMEEIIEAMEELSWVILTVNRHLLKIRGEIKEIKAPQFTMLVRRGRPSTTAIEYEIMMNNDDIKSLEETEETIDNIVYYLKSIESGLDRYLWMLRDKLKD